MNIILAIERFAEYLEEYDPFYDSEEFSFPMPEYKEKSKPNKTEEPVVFDIEEDDDFPFD